VFGWQSDILYGILLRALGAKLVQLINHSSSDKFWVILLKY